MRLASAGIGHNRVQAWLAWVVEAAAASTRASGVRKEAARPLPRPRHRLLGILVFSFFLAFEVPWPRPDLFQSGFCNYHR